MSAAESKIHFFPNEPLIALLGNPNCGKTALFNLLTGSRQKVANYSGVTVERKEGRLTLASEKVIRVLDLPGAYSLYPRSLDERVTCNVLHGNAEGEKRPDLVLCVLNAMNLRRNLRLVLSAKRLGLPCIVVLNMVDVAKRHGITVDLAALSNALGLPVIASVGIQSNGADELKQYLAELDWKNLSALRASDVDEGLESSANHSLHTESDNVQVQSILQSLGLDQIIPDRMGDRLDSVLLHSLFGPIILAFVLFFIFQAVFTWAALPMEAIEAGVN
ncbi:MAG: hypothetical protein RL517_864, partial [Pseudomonadota bacterium]